MLNRYNTVYNVIMAGSLLGFLVPIIYMFVVLTGNGGIYLEKAQSQYNINLSILYWIRDYVFWSDMVIPKGSQFYYIRFSLYGFISIVLMLIFRNRLNLLFTKVDNYLKENKIIYFAFLFIIFTYQSKFFWGFWFSGIAGWDYRNYGSSMYKIELSQFNLNTNNNLSKSSNNPSYLSKGIIEENKIFLSENGCLQSDVWIGFKPEPVAINLGLTGVVFPNRFIVHDTTILNLINTNLEYRFHSRIWKIIKYPEHSVYMNSTKLNYELDNVKNLNKIEQWSVEACYYNNDLFINDSRLMRVYE